MPARSVTVEGSGAALMVNTQVTRLRWHKFRRSVREQRGRYQPGGKAQALKVASVRPERGNLGKASR